MEQQVRQQEEKPKRKFDKSKDDDFLEFDVVVANIDGKIDLQNDKLNEEMFGKKFEVKRVPLTINFNKDLPPVGVAEVYKLRKKIRARLVLKKTGLEVETVMDLTPCLGGMFVYVDNNKSLNIMEVSLASHNADTRIKSIRQQLKEGH